jgi:hypothetical protein
LSDDEYQAVLRFWRRHEERRRAGCPTVSLLISATQPSAASIADALDAAGLTVAFSRAGEPQALAADWLRSIEAEHDVPAEALAFVANEQGTPERALQTAWRTKTAQERELWLRHCTQDAAPQLLAAAETLRLSLDATRGAATHGALARLRALLPWWPARESLALCLAVSSVASLRASLELAATAPELPLLAVVERAAWKRFQPRLDARSRDLLEADTIPMLRLREQTRHAPREMAELGAIASGAPRPTAASTTPLKALASAAIAQARDAEARDSEALLERARSLAEQRLFELLQAEPVTRDLFVLNGLLPFSFGPRKAEVDFVCAALRLAIEVDGYHHFREYDDYRRDRRKDVLLQHQGYLVSRHLASDVLEREAEVVDSIRKLVQRRRRTMLRETAT